MTFIRGINTEYHTGEQNADKLDGICKTMQKLAKATCAEVLGVYNAMAGIRKDIGECLTNIAKESDLISEAASDMIRPLTINFRPAFSNWKPSVAAFPEKSPGRESKEKTRMPSVDKYKDIMQELERIARDQPERVSHAQFELVRMPWDTGEEPTLYLRRDYVAARESEADSSNSGGNSEKRRTYGIGRSSAKPSTL